MIHFIRRLWRRFVIAANRPMTEHSRQAMLAQCGLTRCPHCGRHHP